MPFMIGRNPIRRTLKYLNQGKLYLKNNIQIFSINYNTHGDHHKGANEFVHWFLPQVQYKNPDVQVVLFRNITPSPFIRCYYSNGREMLIDIDNRSKEEILAHLQKVVGKSKSALNEEAIAKVKKDNPGNFGVACSRSCICVVAGQVPCPAVVPLPDHMRGKKRLQQGEE